MARVQATSHLAIGKYLRVLSNLVTISVALVSTTTVHLLRKAAEATHKRAVEPINGIIKDTTAPFFEPQVAYPESTWEGLKRSASRRGSLGGNIRAADNVLASPRKTARAPVESPDRRRSVDILSLYQQEGLARRRSLVARPPPGSEESNSNARKRNRTATQEEALENMGDQLSRSVPSGGVRKAARMVGVSEMLASPPLGNLSVQARRHGAIQSLDAKSQQPFRIRVISDNHTIHDGHPVEESDEFIISPCSMSVPSPTWSTGSCMQVSPRTPNFSPLRTSFTRKDGEETVQSVV
ncbi:hypothetical protein EMMF5_001243 [Cystobasidiomycetes sp. EMM_F5]